MSLFLLNGAELMELEMDSGWKFYAVRFGFVSTWRF